MAGIPRGSSARRRGRAPIQEALRKRDRPPRMACHPTQALETMRVRARALGYPTTITSALRAHVERDAAAALPRAHLSPGYTWSRSKVRFTVHYERPVRIGWLSQTARGDRTTHGDQRRT